MGLPTLLMMICLMTISKAYEVFDEQPCMSRLSTVYTALNHSITLTCSFWSATLKWDKPDNSSNFSTSRENITLYHPVVPGYYTCSSTPCSHLFSVRSCPPEVTVVSYSTETHLTLDCSLSGDRVSWSYNHTRFVQLDLVAKTFHTRIPEGFEKYFRTAYADRYRLNLLAPFLPGTYTCQSGDCSRTIELVYHPQPKPQLRARLQTTEGRQALTPNARLEDPPLRPAVGKPNLIVVIIVSTLVLLLCCSVYYFCFANPCRNLRFSTPYIRRLNRGSGQYSSRNTLISF